MNADELKAALQAYYDEYEDIGVSVYAILKNKDHAAPVKLDIESDALNELKALFVQSLRERISDRDDLSLLSLSSSDERLDAIYEYDLEIPEELTALETVITQDNLPLLDLNDQSLSSIKALLIEIGNNVGQMVLYKTMAAVHIYGRKRFLLKKAATRLEKVDYEILQMTDGFQMLRINDSLLVIDLKALERNFGFHDVIKKEAALGVNAIESISLIENPEVLRELLNDVKYARKLTKIAKSSPVLRAEIPNESIIKFCQTFPRLAGKIRFNEGQDQIVLDTKVSQDLFIKLLMDDFLTSELTNLHYASVAKDRVDSKPQGDQPESQ